MADVPARHFPSGHRGQSIRSSRRTRLLVGREQLSWPGRTGRPGYATPSAAPPPGGGRTPGKGAPRRGQAPSLEALPSGPDRCQRVLVLVVLVAGPAAGLRQGWPGLRAVQALPARCTTLAAPGPNKLALHSRARHENGIRAAAAGTPAGSTSSPGPGQHPLAGIPPEHSQPAPHRAPEPAVYGRDRPLATARRPLSSQPAGPTGPPAPRPEGGATGPAGGHRREAGPDDPDGQALTGALSSCPGPLTCCSVSLAFSLVSKPSGHLEAQRRKPTS